MGRKGVEPPGAPQGLARVFVGSLPAQLPSPGDLELTLLRLVGEARGAWPEISVPDAEFVRHLAHCVRDADAPAKALETLHVADLYLACSCARGDPTAVRSFDERFLSQVPSHLQQLRETASFIDEVRQRLRESLLVAGADHPPKIASYAGRGSLDGWLRVVAMRAALSLKRKEKQPFVEDENAAENALSPRIDPEMEVIKNRYRGEFSAALRDAFTSLSSDDRALMRLYYVDHLTVEEIGPLLSVHFSTISRRLARCRQRLLDTTRSLLRERLKLTPTEFDSVVLLVRSELDVSIHRLLGKTGG